MLDMDINSISFSHHHLFSKEHVLASRLKELYQLYALKEENCIVDYLNERVRRFPYDIRYIRN